jgi:hypothetical protein
MANTTNRFAFQLLYEAQAQKTVTLNEDLINLDALLYLSVVDNAHTVPPITAPADQTVYIIATGATGVWYGKDNQLAVYQASNASWLYFAAVKGMLANNEAVGTLYAYNGTSWNTVPNLNSLTPTLNNVIVGNGTQFVTTDIRTVMQPTAFLWAMLAG